MSLKFDWSRGELAEGLRCYREGRFFEAHEHWETVWLNSPEPEKTFLQALIQMTAAFHHFQRGNRLGTASLLRQALPKLQRFSDPCGPLLVEPLCKQILEWLQALENPAAPTIAFPEIM